MEQFSWTGIITEFGFPIALIVYLLWREGKRLDKIAQNINEFRIGLYLVLSKLNSVEEYTESIRQLKSAGSGDLK